jgi:hypothetical protein
MTALRVSLFTFLLLVFACSGDDNDNDNGNGDAPPPDPQAVLSDAASAVSALKSFHFRLEHENGNSPLPLNLRLVSAEGDVALPDRLKADVRARSGSLNLDVQVLSIGDRTWITNPFSRNLQELPGVNLTDITDPSALLNVVTKELRDVKYVDSKEVGGVDTHHLAGTLDSSVLDGVLPVEAGRSVDVDIYIGKEDDLPRRAEMKGPIASGDESGIIRRIDFSDFDEPVDIAPPR